MKLKNRGIRFILFGILVVTPILMTILNLILPPQRSAWNSRTFRLIPHTPLWVYNHSAVYSADRVYRMGVTVMGLTSASNNIDIECWLQFSDGSSEVVDADLQYINYHCDLFFYCGVSVWCYPTKAEVPTSVVLFKMNTNPTSGVHLSVSSPGKIQESTGKIALCTQHVVNIKSEQTLAEYVELHRLLGVDKIILHGYTNVSINIQKLIEYYQRTGYVDVLRYSIGDWTTGSVMGYEHKDEPDLYYYGLHLTRDDCLARYYHEYEYMLFSDLDEVIMPASKNISRTYQGIIDHLKQTINIDHRSVCEYKFPWTAFCVDDAPIYNLNQKELFSVKYQIRSEPADNFKIIAHVKNALNMKTHFVRICRKGNKTRVEVPPSIAKVHHYRYHPVITQLGATGGCRVKDNAASWYSDELKVKVEEAIVASQSD